MSIPSSPASNSKHSRDLSLGSNRRILKRPDFLRIQNKGKKFRTKHFLLVFVANKEAQESRIGVTVTRKVNKRAVKRNQLRRRIKEIFRHRRGHFVKSADVVIIALSGASELSFPQISRQINYLFYKSELLEEKRQK